MIIYLLKSSITVYFLHCSTIEVCKIFKNKKQLKTWMFLQILKTNPDGNSWIKKGNMSKKQRMYGSPTCEEICKEYNLCC
jgi:hypothetical protein